MNRITNLGEEKNEKIYLAFHNYASIERPASRMFSTHYPTDEPTWRTRVLWVAFTLAVFGFGAIAGYEYAGGQLQPLRVFWPRRNQRDLPIPTASTSLPRFRMTTFCCGGIATLTRSRQRCEAF